MAIGGRFSRLGFRRGGKTKDGAKVSSAALADEYRSLHCTARERVGSSHNKSPQPETEGSNLIRVHLPFVYPSQLWLDQEKSQKSLFDCRKSLQSNVSTNADMV